MKILIIDLNGEFRGAVSGALALDHAILATGSWLEAVNHMESDYFDAVLVNLDSSGLAGLNFLGRLTALYPQICFLAYGQDGSAEDARRYGAREFLKLPFTASKLRQSLVRVVPATPSPHGPISANVQP